MSVDRALRNGSRTLAGGSSLARLLNQKRGVPNRKALQALVMKSILRWAKRHHKRTGQWPNQNSGMVIGAKRESWNTIDRCLRDGSRGLSGGSSLARLLGEKCGARTRASIRPLTTETILVWADRHHSKTGHWPRQNSGKVTGVQGEDWRNVDGALLGGYRGLPGGSSLARLLSQKCGVRNIQSIPPLTVKTILRWADHHHDETGQWPKSNSGRVTGTDGEDWMNISQALRSGLRGLAGGSSLPRLLCKERGVPNVGASRPLSKQMILAWADLHHRRTGQWPKLNSGAVIGTKGEFWNNIDRSLRVGRRGLPGGSSLPRLLSQERGTRNIGALGSQYKLE